MKTGDRLGWLAFWASTFMWNLGSTLDRFVGNAAPSIVNTFVCPLMTGLSLVMIGVQLAKVFGDE